MFTSPAERKIRHPIRARGHYRGAQKVTATVWTIMARGLNLTKMASSLENMATRRRMLRTKRMTQLWRHSFECCVSLALRVVYLTCSDPRIGLSHGEESCRTGTTYFFAFIRRAEASAKRGRSARQARREKAPKNIYIFFKYFSAPSLVACVSLRSLCASLN